MSLKDLSTGTAFCIFINTALGGPVPSVIDGEDSYVVYKTERAAQCEIVDNAITRLQQFLEGERDFDDVMIVDEYVVPISLQDDRSFVDEFGNSFRPYRLVEEWS